MNLNGHWGLGGPYDPEEEGLVYEEHELLDCPECGDQLEFDMDYDRYICTNDACNICNSCMQLSAEDVAELAGIG